MLDSNIRIGIIGAGAAGLSTAWALKHKGYKNITLLEKEAIVGGKCHTFYYQNRPFELGAVFLTPAYKNTLSIMAELGLKVVSLRKNNRVFLNTNGIEIKLIDKLDLIKFYWEVFIVLPYLFLKYRKIFQPGYKHVYEDLYQSFETFCEKNNLQLFAKFANTICSAFGYGYFDKVPTAYYLKYLKLSIILAILKQEVFTFADGTATICKKLAIQFDVRYKQEIISIKRNEIIQVTTQDEIFKFDKLILACPLDNCLDFLDTTVEEQHLFSQINYNTYYSFAFIVDNMPDKDRGYFPENCSRNNQGHTMCWFRKYPDINLYIFYAIANNEQKIEDVEEIIIKDLNKIGATIKEKYIYAKWKYFPHVSTEAMQNKFYERLESLQGINNTYFTGELLNFSYVEGVIEYSYALVKKFF